MVLGFLLIDIFLFAVLPIAVLLLLMFDNKWWATILLVSVGGWLTWSNGIPETAADIFSLKTLKYVSIYGTIGFIFSFAKWKMLAIKVARDFSAFVNEKRSSELTKENIASAWNSKNAYKGTLIRLAVQDDRFVTKVDKLELTEYVMMWTIYWPFYALLLLLDDVLRHVFTWFTEIFSSLFSRIADDSFKDIE